MTRSPAVLVSSLLVFTASVIASYHLSPSLTQKATPALHHAQRENLFSMVHRLASSNQKLEGQAGGVLKNLQQAHRQLGALATSQNQLSQEVSQNQIALHSMAKAISLNQALVQSQHAIISRENVTHQDNAAVKANILALGGQVTQVDDAMATLYHTSVGLSNNMGALSSTLRGVLIALEALQSNTTLPVVNVPATSVLPPVFGSSSSSNQGSSGTPTHHSSSPGTSLTSPVQSILGGL